MTDIPAICGCGAVWFTRSLVSIGAGASTRMTNCKVSPCPECGGVGRIPDGMYKSSSFAIDNKTDLELVLRAIKELQTRIKAGAPPEKAREELRSKYPWLSSLLRFAPTNPTEFAAYLVAIIMVVQCSNEATTNAPQQVQVQVEMSEAFEKALGELRTNQQKNQEGQQPPAPPPGPTDSGI